jgi:hypothetical protein
MDWCIFLGNIETGNHRCSHQKTWASPANFPIRNPLNSQGWHHHCQALRNLQRHVLKSTDRKTKIGSLETWCRPSEPTYVNICDTYITYIYIIYIYDITDMIYIYNYIYRHIISINGPIIYGTNPIPLPSLTIILLSMVLVCPVPPMKSQWLVPNPIFPYPESSAQPVPPVPQDLGTQPTQSFHCRLLRLPWTKMDMPESILKLNIWVSPKLGPTIWIIWMMNTDDQPWFLLGIHHFETNPWLIQSRLMQQL